MFRRATVWTIFQLLTGLFLCVIHQGAHAQLQPADDFEHRYATEVSKARSECLRLWSNHVFDPFRNKLNLSEEKPTFSMLKSTEKLNRNDRPIADLAIKTVEQCRTVYDPEKA